MTDNSTISPIMYKMMPWIAAMAFFMQMLDSSILNTALPAIAQDLHESPLNMQSAVICYALALALFIPISGFLSDKFGSRNIFVFSVLLFSCGSLLCALSSSLLMLDISRVIQGIGGAMMVPVARLVLIKSYRRSEFLAALNTSTIPGLIGPVVGPLLGGYFVESLTWHWIFLINIPIGVIGMITGWKYLPNIKSSRTIFDTSGVTFIALGVISVTLGIEFINQNIKIQFSIALFIIGLFSLLFYIKHAKKTYSPIFPLVLFNIHTFKFGYRHVLLFNTTFIGLIIMTMALLNQDSPLIFFALLLFLLGATNSLQFTAMNSITLADLPKELTSSGNSLMAVNQQLAISFGIACGAVLVKILRDQNEIIHHNDALAFKFTFLILGILTCLSGLIFRRLNSQDGQNLIN